MKKLLRIAFMLGLIATILCGAQFIQVFPGIIQSAMFDSAIRNRPLPKGVESRFVTTSDGIEIEVWRKPSQVTPVGGPPRVVLFFHGNGNTLFSAFRLQEWLSELGFTAYAVEWRGYGRSGGWPYETGLYRDAEAAFTYIAEREKISPDKLTVVGYSLGSAPAAYLAAKIQPKALVLLAPFASIQSVLKQHPILKYIRSAVRLYRFPVSEYVAKLTKTCLVVVTGGEDKVLPSKQGDEVIAAYHGELPAKRVHSELATHNDLFVRTKTQLGEAINGCVGAL